MTDQRISDLSSLRPAAEYVRMSTEHQQYSTENQRDVIREYATRSGFTIVRTFADDGRSGLRIEGRDSLRQLIAEVEAGKAEFRAILVYDVSRWGRFQDTDEAAYYEHICKRAGIEVHYCAEQFSNDGSPMTAVIKSIKRTMAGEYSRELSAKVFRGQCRLITLGYRQGGPAGYGLRRMLIDQSGKEKGILARGEHKSLQTDRVKLVPGPDHEVDTVRTIYHAFIEDGKRESEIASSLNDRGVLGQDGQPWTRSMVQQVLTNEKYIGNNVYNRVSFKLKQKRVRNRPDDWVRADGVFRPIVDASLFYTARGIIQERNRVFSNDELLDHLRQLLMRMGHLSAPLIDGLDDMPPSSVYRHRFGSLLDAYRLVGYRPDRDYDFIHVNRRLRALYPNVVSSTADKLRTVGARVQHDDDTDRLVINGEYSAAIVLTRCRQTPSGSLRWRITLDQPTPPDITIVCRMDAANEVPVDYYLLPMLGMDAPRLSLHEDNGVYIDTYRFDSLNYLVEMSSRIRIEVAA